MLISTIKYVGRHEGRRFDLDAAAAGTTPQSGREALDRQPEAGTPAPKATLGQRLRDARRALSLTQDELGRPDFTKGFISLLEHDRANG